MPANPKFLTTPWQRAGKISAGFIGGLLLTTAVHMLIGVSLTDKSWIINTTIWSSWIMWVGLMIYAYFFEKAWKVWALYIGLTLVLSVIIYFIK